LHLMCQDPKKIAAKKPRKCRSFKMAANADRPLLNEPSKWLCSWLEGIRTFERRPPSPDLVWKLRPTMFAIRSQGRKATSIDAEETKWEVKTDGSISIRHSIQSVLRFM
jgi:hypothetical protein